MISIGSMLLILGIAIVTGKHMRHISVRVYFFAALLAFVLVCLILYDMFTMPYPVL